jgi:Ran GTPase-activating protein (RanGAP) involved in mRNA processing and transport
MDEPRLWSLAHDGDIEALAALHRQLLRRGAPDAALARLRALCDRRAPLLALALTPPSASAWVALCDAIDHTAAEDPTSPDLTRQLRAIDASLHPWPDALRLASDRWLDAVRLRAPCPGWPLVRAAHPILAWWGQLAQLDREGTLHHLTQLDLSQLGLSGAEVEDLTRLPLFQRLHTLTLSRNPIAARGVEALSRATHPNGLRALSLSRCSLQGGLYPLQGAHALSRLAALDLSSNSLADAAFSAITSCPPFRSGALQTLNLSSNRLRDRSLRALARADALRSLIDLDLSDNHLEGSAGAALLAIPAHLTLRRLNLSQNRLGPDALQTLCSLSALPALTDLDLRGNLIGPRGSRALAAAPFSPNLQSLRLDTNWITDAGLFSLCHLTPPSLSFLSLSNNLIEDDGAQHLSASALCAHVQRLDLSHNLITDLGAISLAQSPALQQLQWLDLRHNPITDLGADSLRRSPHLRRAYLML